METCHIRHASNKLPTGNTDYDVSTKGNYFLPLLDFTPEGKLDNMAHAPHTRALFAIYVSSKF
jgi:hypothetical protein